MTKTFAAGTNNDFLLGANGSLSILSGKAAVEQNCQTAMQAQRGEMVYNMSGGMPMRANVFDIYNPQLFEAAGRSVLLGVQGVKSVQHFRSYISEGVLFYTAVIQTIYGSGLVSSSFTPSGSSGTTAGDILDYNFILDESSLGAGA